MLLWGGATAWVISTEPETLFVLGTTTYEKCINGAPAIVVLPAIPLAKYAPANAVAFFDSFSICFVFNYFSYSYGFSDFAPVFNPLHRNIDG